VSFVFDQHYWGRRIAALGVGPAPLRHRTLTVERLRDAIQSGVHNSPMRQRAAALGRKIKAENGIANAIRVIEQIGQRRSTT
jgi:UDP:flavonoid glycosyltransferase YjiC (YdhE family)